MKYKHVLMLLVLNTLIIAPVYAQEEAASTSGFSDVGKYLAASAAFIAAAMAAGLAIGKAGSAGLAAAAERPEMRTTAIIITALGEAIAIYGIVVAILILGA